jgi:DinB superfamily
MMTGSLAIAPDSTEFAPYYGKYISLVKSDNIIATLEAQGRRSQDVYGSLTEAQSGFRYAPDKWSIRQMLGHVVDAERIFSYRALRIARGDKTPIEGFEQDGYVLNGPFEHCTLAELSDEFALVRRATVLLFRGLPAESWTRRGIASNNEVSVRALAYIIAGHELHHIEVLNQKYLPALKASR